LAEDGPEANVPDARSDFSVQPTVERSRLRRASRVTCTNCTFGGSSAAGDASERSMNVTVGLRAKPRSRSGVQPGQPPQRQTKNARDAGMDAAMNESLKCER
jgi:hypothetical protein